jgi:ubiquinone/menaquinone biosynthesis C-methylase UbiE
MSDARVRSALFLVCVLLASVAGAQTRPATMEEMRRLHQNPGEYIATLDDPARDAYQKPSEVVTALGLKNGDVVADIGAGSGYFTFRFAHHVGASGRVYAIDISPDMILHMNRRIRALGLDNVRTLLVPADDPLLPAHSVDHVFICDTWHHIGNHAQYLARLKEAVKPGGDVTIIDFQKKPTPVGSPPEMRVAREDVVREFQRNGFRLAREHTFLPYQYFLVFAPTR